jgi:hypothetical protein
MIDSRASFVRLIETDDAQGHKAEAVMPLGLILKKRETVSRRDRA